MKIVDAHFHLWDLELNYYPWLSDGDRPSVVGDYTALRRSYRIGDFLADIGDLDVIAAVHIQAEHDPRDHVRETRWLQGVAEAPASRGLPQAIVANADLADPEAERVLEAHAAFANVRGIRQAVHRRLNEHPPYDPLKDPAWLKAFPLLRRYGLTFDLQLFPHQVDDAVALIRDNPDTVFVLTHCAMPLWPDRDSRALWRANLVKLAAFPNVSVKLSGFGLWDPKWTAVSIAPMVRLLIDRFSVERCMLASNFPVESLARGYRAVWDAYDKLFAAWSADERHALFCANALRIYRISPP